jgi:intracellular septation protein A
MLIFPALGYDHGMKLPPLFNDPEFREFIANLTVTLLSIASSIIAYYLFGGLIPSIIATLVVLPACMLLLKLSNINIEPLQYVTLFFLTVLGLPAIFLDHPFMAKIQEPISGLIMGGSFTIISLLSPKSIIKTVTPNFIKNIPFLQKHLFSKSDAVWKKIDYVWAAEMMLSAALSMAAVFLLPTDLWFIAKMTIGPILSFIAFGLSYAVLQSDHTAPLIASPIPNPEPFGLSQSNESPLPSPSLFVHAYGNDEEILPDALTVDSLISHKDCDNLKL